MAGFYVADRCVMRWVGEWIHRGPTGRPMLADQLRFIRSQHGRSVARAFRDHLVWVGSYPERRAMYARRLPGSNHGGPGGGLPQ